MIFFLFLNQIAHSYDFPTIKKPKKGIFRWFSALSSMKNGFNNKTILGFRSNTSEPDLKMIASDLVTYLELKDLNLSQKIADSVTKYDPNNLIRSKSSKSTLLSKSDCYSEYQNVHQFCKLTGIKLNFTEYGVSEEHVDILIGNVIGYFPCGLFFLILGCVTIVFYIIQLFLCCFYCKAVEHSRASVASIIFFYLGDAIVLVAAVLYFFSYSGVNSMFNTLITLDTVVPSCTKSLASSLKELATKGVPDSLSPLINNVLHICNTTFNYVKVTANSFIQPALLLQEKMIYEDQSDMGVFPIYNKKIRPTANSFYDRASLFPKLENISKYFGQQDWEKYTKQMKDFLDKEEELAEKMVLLDTFFDYLNNTIDPYKKFVEDFPNQEVKGTNKTVIQLIDDLEQKSLYSFESLTKLNENTKEKRPLYRFICAVYFIYGIVLAAAPIFFGVQFMLHTRCSRCVATTVSVYPLVATVLMFLLVVVFTSIGFADVSMSDQFEPSIDTFLTDVVGDSIPQREITFPLINITFYTKDTYRGVLKLSKMLFLDPMNNLEHFFFSSTKDGIAESLNLQQIADIDRYGQEIGNFIIDMGEHFELPQILVYLFQGVRELFKSFYYFPDSIDGFFNWEVPMLKTTKELRDQINKMDPDAMPFLESYLSEIDTYVDEMNSQYQIVLYQIYHNLADAFDKIEERIETYIRSIMNDLGTIIKDLCKQVYPVLNLIKNEPVIGPYAVIRNFFFYDLASTSAYLSASGTLMMIGLVFIVVLMWIRRKGMLSSDDIQLKRNQSNKLEQNDENDEKGNQKLYI